MSVPHTYATDRLCLVPSGTWWVSSGRDFDPNATVPVPDGGFVRRVAHTPHYDGVKKNAMEPVVMGIFRSTLNSSIRASRRGAMPGRCFPSR